MTASKLQRHRDRRVIRRLVPAADVAAHVRRRDRALEVGRGPDMVEAAALVGGGPVRRAVAPPGIDALRLGMERTQRVDELRAMPSAQRQALVRERVAALLARDDDDE